ncbi:MAG: NFACT family protein [Tyzzerella sp.]|uniref:Rqc2 homolog RqcH n=1 Tax=Candidatus Fimicola merdigallinarum TaxID=2840819 RepID=A0A9D9DWV9_9FIRM|nr:NFACT family protein [Candidatus Fimicola merdigallinarum]
MALDGITLSNIVSELRQKLIGGRIDKIYQPLNDEIILSVRSLGKNLKILLTANSSHPRIHITEIQKDNPNVAPMFCMVLRKYIAGGKIVSIEQPDFERIINIKIEGLNELGDLSIKTLTLEIMGKHSNIILIDENGKILDSIKRVSHDKSSVREVLPNKQYALPPSQGKKNPINTNKDEFISLAKMTEGQKTQSFIYKSYTGISPIMASEICFRAKIDPSSYCGELDDISLSKLYTAFDNIFSDIKAENYNPEIIYEEETDKIVEFSSLPMTQFGNGFRHKPFQSISTLLEEFYAERDNMYHINQKAHDMKRVILTNIERCVKKADIQKKTLKSIENMDDWRIKGELLTANIYAVQKGMTSFKTINFYDENMPEIEIAIDPLKTPSENAQKYFSKYNKAKRTMSALEIQKKQNDEELLYLESILNSLEASTSDSDLSEIREELALSGYMKRKTLKKGKAQKIKKSKPIHYVSSEGFDIFVGKSNLQNDDLTLHFAGPNDLWLHTKNIPGSHVIIKTEGKINDINDLPDNTLIEGANLAVLNSKAKDGTLVPVDYTFRKHIKKPNGSKPGMVIYDQNWSLYITPDKSKLKDIKVLED